MKIENITMSEESLNHYFYFKDKINNLTSRNIEIDTGYYNDIEFKLVKYGIDVTSGEYLNIKIDTPYIYINDSSTNTINSYLSIDTVEDFNNDNRQILGNNNLSIFMWINFPTISNTNQNTNIFLI